MNKLFLVAYNPGTNFDAKAFHKFIDELFKSGKISDWWHHIDSSYLVASNLHVSELYNQIFPAIPGSNLLIIEVNPNNTQGWLPETAWTWIKKYQSK